MRNILLFFGICAGVMSAQEATFLDRPTTSPKLWRASITALAVANVVDVHSSWGKHELNSTLSGPSGNFGKEGALIKLGFQGGLIGFEYLITRGHPSRKLYRALSAINFGVSATIAGVAAHNYTVPPPR
jgi:hypothetical protein